MERCFLQILCFCLSLVECMVTPKVLIKIMDEFRMKDFVLQNQCFTFADQRELFKIFSDRGKMINLSGKIFNQHQSIIKCIENILEFNLNEKINVPMLVISQIESKINFNKIKLSIGDEVYFLDQNNFKIYESYNINNIYITRYLGQFQNVSKNYEFVPAADFYDSIVERRGDFHGLQLIGMSEKDPPQLDFPDNFTDNASYFPNNGTYDVTQFVNGSYIDILNHLEKSLNFSTKLYKRKDGVWGMPQEMSNGSVLLNGILQSTAEGPGDIICAPLGVLPQRFPYLDFLPPLSDQFGTLFIAKHNNYEKIDWMVYLGPFTNKLWLSICIFAIPVTIIIVIIRRLYLIEKVKQI